MLAGGEAAQTAFQGYPTYQAYSKSDSKISMFLSSWYQEPFRFLILYLKLTLSGSVGSEASSSELSEGALVIECTLSSSFASPPVFSLAGNTADLFRQFVFACLSHRLATKVSKSCGGVPANDIIPLSLISSGSEA